MSRRASIDRAFLQVPDSYLRLIRRFPLRPIRSDAAYAAATAIMDKLAIRDESTLDAGERDYLSVLSDLIEAYDDAHYPLPDDSRPPYERLAGLVRDQKMTAQGLAEVLGVGRSLACLILGGKRRITADHAKALGARFKLEPGYFL